VECGDGEGCFDIGDVEAIEGARHHPRVTYPAQLGGDEPENVVVGSVCLVWDRIAHEAKHGTKPFDGLAGVMYGCRLVLLSRGGEAKCDVTLLGDDASQALAEAFAAPESHRIRRRVQLLIIHTLRVTDRDEVASPAVDTGRFDYDLPESAIAQTPIEPRDAARLLRCDPLEDHVFRELPDLLKAGDLLVVNRTRVRAARLRGVKAETGGAVELLLLRRVDPERWEALLRPSRRIHTGTRLVLGPILGEVLSEPVRGMVVARLEAEGQDIEDVIAAAGEVPLPPYIHRTLDDPERYQTIFAKTVGSAAAPTASLHFTETLRAEILRRGIEIAEVDLMVGLDTFRPIAADNIADHEMHRESWEIPASTAAAIAAVRQRDGRVVAAGTTVVRTLESAASGSGLVTPGAGETDLFISPGYRLRVVDAVITNFHAPRTTLIVMIAALLGERWRSVYEHALTHGYRFLSFGDAMLIERPVNRI
jgi:S-adenosylmethionine:tRNA ribosyltransferase-isomerase